MHTDRVRQAAVAAAVAAGMVAGASGDYGSAGASDSLVLPADYAFGIWFPVYAGSIAYAAHQARPSMRTDPLLRRIGWPSAVAYLSAGLWVWTDPMAAPWSSVAAMALTIAPGVAALVRMGPASDAGTEERWLVRAPIGLFTGWITLAVVANTTEVLLANGVRQLAGLDAEPWAVLALLAAGSIGSFTTLRTTASAAYPAAVVWGLVAAAVQQLPRSTAAGVAAATMAGLVAAVGRVASRRSAPRPPRRRTWARRRHGPSRLTHQAG